MKFEPALSRTAYRETRLDRGSSVLAGKVGRAVSMSLLFFIKKKKDRTTNDNGRKEEKKPRVKKVSIKKGQQKTHIGFLAPSGAGFVV